MKKGFRILKFKKDKPIFEVKDINKSFDGRPILKKLSLKVFPGECVGVLGPNGCGKTTLFSMCIGEQNPEGGKIYLNNKAIDEIPMHQRSKLGLGYLPQQRSVFNMSVYENILGIAQISIKDSQDQKAITEKLLDEPLAALDPLVIQDIQKYILKIQSSGTAILVTDHNVKNLFDITDRSYVLGEQSVIAEGTSRELLKSSKAIEHYFGSQF